MRSMHEASLYVLVGALVPVLWTRQQTEHVICPAGRESCVWPLQRVAAPSSSPHSSLPDAGTEPVIRRLASAVARDAVPDPGGDPGLLSLHLSSPSLSRTSTCMDKALAARPRRLAQNPVLVGGCIASPFRRQKKSLAGVLKRPLHKEAASTGTSCVLAQHRC